MIRVMQDPFFQDCIKILGQNGGFVNRDCLYFHMDVNQNAETIFCERLWNKQRTAMQIKS